MSTRRIYVDIDDVLSRTVEHLIDLLEHLHDRRVELDACQHFDLARSFSLAEHEIREFMAHAHRDEMIESIRPVEGAAEVLGDWDAAGDRVHLVTGRPPLTNAASRRWLARHDLRHESLHHLDKWGRPDWNDEGLPALGFEDVEAFGFDFAVEDSLDTAVRLVEDFGIPVALVDRPWNRSADGLPRRIRARMVRCRDWGEIEKAFG